MGERGGFLRGRGIWPPPETRHIACGTGQKRIKTEEREAASKKPRGGPRPILTMVLKKWKRDYRIRVLLGTGCSIPLISQKTVGKLGIPVHQHNAAIPLENFMGQTVDRAGQYYTEPQLLQHRRHVTRESFEVSPMEEGTDIFLRFWWIAKHPPQGAWQDPEIRFNSVRCLEEFTVYEQADFPLTWDEGIAHDPNAGTIGNVWAVTNEDARLNVPMEFRPYMGIMSQEATDDLPEHRPYECKIELKNGSTAPWGPIYPLSEVELQTLREWLKEME